MNSRQKRGLVLLAVGAVLVLCGLGMHLAQRQEDIAAGQTAAVLLQQLEVKLPPVDDAVTESEQPESEHHTPADPVLPERKYMGYTLLGSIHVPSVGVRLPILDQWSEEMLKVAPCRYAGSISGGNMIIMGHNYKSHFGYISQLKIGDAVIFTDMDGNVTEYKVVGTDVLAPTEVETIIAGDFDLTLFTCTYGGKSRVTVYCDKN